MSLVKRGNLKRSKLATNPSINDNSFMGSGIGEDTSIQKVACRNDKQTEPHGPGSVLYKIQLRR